MVRCLWCALVLAGLTIPSPKSACAAPPVLGAPALSARIDELIDARLAKENVPTAPTADDAEFFRRLSLDLNGRIPTLAQLADSPRSSSVRIWG